MTSSALQTALHVLLALAVLAAACTLAALGVIPGSDAFAMIVAVAVGGGVIAGVALTPGAAPAVLPPTAVVTSSSPAAAPAEPATAAPSAA